MDATQIPHGLYGHSLWLLTDLYQLTMAYGYWKAGIADKQAVFDLFFRKNPFNGGFGIACGLEYVIDFLDHYRIDEGDLDYLATLRGANGKPLFESAFLHHLRGLQSECDVDALPEGTAVFANEPLIRVAGPLMQCQLLETPLLAMMNYQTLIATKAARVCLAARGDPVLEFGLRRAPGIDGGLTASRAAYVGGCAGTSNVLAGKMFGIPLKGTHAHSWVMAFDSEPEAFEQYARAMPNNCLFLVDTYGTLQGIRNAIAVGRKLRESGHELLGVRLDSGDLAYLSNEARRMLDEAGFTQAAVVGSGDVDEHIIASLKEQGAAIGVWGVGTRMVTGHDDPSLAGVYKLAAIRDPDGSWQYKIKLSEQTIKTTIPGVQQVRRFEAGGLFVADAIYDVTESVAEPCTIIDPADSNRRKVIAQGTAHCDLLVPVFRRGRCVYDVPRLADARKRTGDQLSRLHPGIKRLENPHEYPVGLERNLHRRWTHLVRQAKGLENDA